VNRKKNSGEEGGERIRKKQTNTGMEEEKKQGEYKKMPKPIRLFVSKRSLVSKTTGKGEGYFLEFNLHHHTPQRSQNIIHQRQKGGCRPSLRSGIGGARYGRKEGDWRPQPEGKKALKRTKVNKKESRVVDGLKFCSTSLKVVSRKRSPARSAQELSA